MVQTIGAAFACSTCMEGTFLRRAPCTWPACAANGAVSLASAACLACGERGRQNRSGGSGLESRSAATKGGLLRERHEAAVEVGGPCNPVCGLRECGGGAGEAQDRAGPDIVGTGGCSWPAGARRLQSRGQGSRRQDGRPRSRDRGGR